jgi:hypothetical protein
MYYIQTGRVPQIRRQRLTYAEVAVRHGRLRVFEDRFLALSPIVALAGVGWYDGVFHTTIREFDRWPPAREESDKDVRINREHVAVGLRREYPPSRRAHSCPSGRLSEIARGGHRQNQNARAAGPQRRSSELRDASPR